MTDKSEVSVFAPDSDEQALMIKVALLIDGTPFNTRMNALIYLLVIESLRAGADSHLNGKKMLLDTITHLVNGCWDSASSAVDIVKAMESVPDDRRH